MASISRRSFLKATGASAAALGLAACGNSGSGSSDSSSIKLGVLGPYSGSVAQ